MERNTNRAERSVKRLSISTMAFILAAVVLFGGVVGGTLAWLTKSTNSIQNTFIVGDITSLTLSETKVDPTTGTLVTTGEQVTTGTQEFRLFANSVIAKDPKVIVGANSLNCYVFVKMTVSENFTQVAEMPTIADGWTALTDADPNDNVSTENVYYYEYTTNAAAEEKYILKGTTPVSATNSNPLNPTGEIRALSAIASNFDYSSKPSISFKAYAIQKSGPSGVYDAYKSVLQAEN